MGIQGLTAFVDKRPHLLKEHKLCNSRIVIDGNNFYYFLYYFFHVRLLYGGDYDAYALKIRKVFEGFTQCGVQAFVVLDGGDLPDNRKLATQLKRCRERLRMARQLARGQRGAVLPVLAFQTFLTVLQDMKVPHAICDFEADDVVASLAAQWECPVMSNDSDFFVYDLKGGLILFDYADLAQLRRDKNGQAYMAVELYSAERFARFSKVDRKTLPLFATLVGNDYVDKARFLSFISGLPRLKSRGKLSARQELFVKVLDWLGTVDSVDAAKKYVLSRVDNAKAASVRDILDVSMSHYSALATPATLKLMQHFHACAPAEKCSSGQDQPEGKCLPGLASDGKASMPSWCDEALRCGKLYPFIKNCFLLHHIILLNQVEDFKCLSVNATSAYIRQVIYGILLSPSHVVTKGENVAAKGDNAEAKRNGAETKGDNALTKGGNAEPKGTSAGAKRENVVMEYDRCGQSHDIRRVAVSPIWNVPGVEHVPALAEVPSWPVTDKLQVLAGTLGVAPEFVSSLPEEVRLLGSVLVYWARHAKPEVSHCHLSALLVCVILLSARQELRARRLAWHQSVGSEDSSVPGDSLCPDEESDEKEFDAYSLNSDCDDGCDAETEVDKLKEGNFILSEGDEDSDDDDVDKKEEEVTGEEDDDEEGVNGNSRSVDTSKESLGNACSTCSQERADGIHTCAVQQEKLCADSLLPSRDQSGITCQDSVSEDGCLHMSAADRSDRNHSCQPVKNGSRTDRSSETSRPEDAASGVDLQSSRLVPGASIQAACSLLPEAELECIVQRLEKFRVPPPRTRSHPGPDVAVIHAFAQLQACLLHATYLCAALQWPAPPPRPQLLIGATFLYTFFLELQRRSQPLCYIEEMLGKLWNVFHSVREAVLTQLPADALKNDGSRRVAKRKKKTAARHSKTQPSSLDLEGETEGSGMEALTRVIPACSVTNRFGLLALDAD